MRNRCSATAACLVKRLGGKHTETHRRSFPGGASAPEQWVYVIERDGESVGVLWIAQRADDFAQELWDDNIEVDERYRRQVLRGTQCSSPSRKRSDVG